MGKPLGDMLVEAGAITEAQLRQAIQAQSKSTDRLASTLYRLGMADEATLAAFLSRKQGLPYAVLSESAIPLEMIKIFPRDMAKKLSALPLRLDGDNLVVGMSDPHDFPVLDEIRFATGYQIIEHGVLMTLLDQAIEEAYGLLEAGKESFWKGKKLALSAPIPKDGCLKVVTGQAGAAPPPLPSPSDEAVLDMDQLGVIELAPVSKPREDGKLTMLIVDDDESIRSMLSRYFVNLGYFIVEAIDGTQALSFLQRELPDIIVLDAMLPGVHGFDICRQVKNTPTTRHIPVVMISAIYRGWGYATDVTQKYGADAFLEKPFSLRELGSTIKKALLQRKKEVVDDDLSAKAESAVLAAADAYGQGDLKSAAVHLQKAIEASPFSSLLHRKLAQLYEKLNEPYRALVEMERAVQLNPSCANLFQFALLLTQAGFTHKAIESLERSLKLAQEPTLQKEIQDRIHSLLQMSQGA